MNKEYEENNAEDMDKEDFDLAGAIQKIQKHLMFLEKKLDTLIDQSQKRSFNRDSRPFNKDSRPFNKGNHFSKPYKPYNSQSQSYRSEGRKEERGFDRPWKGNGRSNSGPHKKRRFRPAR